jgi:hypothetical protein
MKPSRVQSPRVLIAVLVSAATCFIVTGTLLAFFRTEESARVSQRTLTFEERVSYQRAIEDVYWRHRIWPKERTDPKPSLYAVMSQEQLEKKVADYLRTSQMLEDYWHRPLTAEQLQAEMERMAQHSKQPEVLRELFAALGNDPFVIAERLARPALAERLLTNWYAYDQRIHGELRQCAEAELQAHSSTEQMKQTGGKYSLKTSSGDYKLPKISDGCVGNTWTATAGPPDVRERQTAVWTGSEMIVWGGFNSTKGAINTGGRYNPSTDSWMATSTTHAPLGRYYDTAVWTGSEMIVWGGGGYSNTGGRYNASADSWIATTTTNAPSGRDSHGRLDRQ